MDNVVEWLVYSDAVFGGISESVGFPSTNGAGVAVSPQLRLGMSSSSDAQDGVWQFLNTCSATVSKAVFGRPADTAGAGCNDGKVV